MKRIILLIIISYYILTSLSVYGQQVYSATSGEWRFPSTWVGGIIPDFGDSVYIMSTHHIVVTADSKCAHLIFPQSDAIFEVESGVTFYTNSIQLFSNSNQDTYCDITGGGTIICYDDLNIGTIVNPEQNTINLSLIYLSISNIEIGGNIIFTGSQNGSRHNNPGLFIENSSVKLDGQISFAHIPASSVAMVYFSLDNSDFILYYETPWGNHQNFSASSGWGNQITNGATFNINLSGVNSTVYYGRNGNQTINRESATTGNILTLDYNNLVLSGSGTKTLPTTSVANVYETLSMQGSAVMANKSPVFHDYSTLEYKGSVAQTTTDYEFPQTGGPQYLIIDNPLGVSLNSDKTLKTSDINLLLLNSGTLNNSSFNVSLLSGSAVYRTGGSVSASPTYNTEVNIYYSDHTASVVSGPEIPEASSLIKNITVQNLNGVEFSNNITLCQKLIIGSNAIANVAPGKGLTVTNELNNNGTYTLQSDNSGTATLLCTNMIGNGTFNMEQYLTGSGGSTPDGRMWYLGSPMENASSGVFDANGNNKLWSYSEASFSYTEITNNTTSLNPMEGYVVRLGATETVTFTGGKFNNGTFTNSNLTRTGTTNSKRGYHLIANPYPAYLDWATADTVNIMSTIWYRTVDLSLSPVFDTYNSVSDEGTNNNGFSEVTRHIPPLQSFWIKVSTDGLTGSLSFNNTMLSHQNNNLLKNNTLNNIIRISLCNGSNIDETLILFNDNAGTGFDAWDSEKMFNSSISASQIWSNESGVDLVINSLPAISYGMTIPLYINVASGATGQHELSFNLSRFDSTTEVMLEDLFTNNFHNIRNGVYAFSSNSVTNYNRFVLHFNPVVTNTGNSEIIYEPNIYSESNKIYIHVDEKSQIEIFNTNGQLVLIRELQAGHTTIQMSSGIYIARVIGVSNTIERKLLIY